MPHFLLPPGPGELPALGETEACTHPRGGAPRTSAHPTPPREKGPERVGGHRRGTSEQRVSVRCPDVPVWQGRHAGPEGPPWSYSRPQRPGAVSPAPRLGLSDERWSVPEASGRVRGSESRCGRPMPREGAWTYQVPEGRLPTVPLPLGPSTPADPSTDETCPRAAAPCYWRGPPGFAEEHGARGTPVPLSPAQPPGMGSPGLEKKELDRVHSKLIAFRSQGQPSRPPPGLRGSERPGSRGPGITPGA